MILSVILLGILAHAGPIEDEVVSVFNRSQSVHEKFLKDTMASRKETENYNENEFVPAAKKMISLLDKQQCKKCVVPYLNGLSFLKGSANEDLTNQMKEVIERHPKALNTACSKLKESNKKDLSVILHDASRFFAEASKTDQAKIEKRISKCF